KSSLAHFIDPLKICVKAWCLHDAAGQNTHNYLSWFLDKRQK
ncbi:7104_t:CDS:1, partial [Racocetra persica]